MYDYFLGGKDNFAADRAAAEQLRAVSPELSITAWANRRFHQRAARFIASDNVSAVLGDLREPADVLAAVRSTGLVDLDQPCGLLISAVLHFVAEADDPYGSVSALVAALPPGSYLSLSHVTADGVPTEKIRNGVSVYRGASASMNPRSHAEVTRFFDGLSLVPPWPGAPGEVNRVSLWGPPAAPSADEVTSAGTESWWCAVGRK
jgi:hypothetical protein